ncbi:MAG: hemerythrin domain-containing protein [Deltaproteobacteria bacterium]|nr:hemerythrin domain-containing protein [Deltaproteobacteria bacterium]
MTTIVEFMTAVHRQCDEALAAAEEAVGKQNWPEASQRWTDFAAEMALHFAREEKALFPAFEEATGMTEGPTSVMRMEHEQMRQLFAQLSEAVAAQDGERFLGLSETLMMLVQQHNMKEEQMLYPMCDRALTDTSSIIARLEKIVGDSE